MGREPAAKLREAVELLKATRQSYSVMRATQLVRDEIALVQGMTDRLRRIEAAEQEAEARKGDPITAKFAAKTVDEMSRRHQEVWWCLRSMEPSTDEEIVAEFDFNSLGGGKYTPQSPQSVRSRRCELVRMGFVEAVDRKGITRAGRMATRWKAVGMPQAVLFKE